MSAAQPMQASLNLGVIGNCAYNALIDERGRVVWCCLPRFDGDPVFNALLDPGETGSLWAFEVEDFARSEQFYIPNTAILRTRLYDQQGQGIEITDFAPRFNSHDRMFRPLTMIRRVNVISGTPRVRVLMRPRFDWGRQEPTITQGSHHIRFIGSGARQALRLTSDAPLNYLFGETYFVVDRQMNFVLGPDETLMGGVEDTARAFELYRDLLGFDVRESWQADGAELALYGLAAGRLEQTATLIPGTAIAVMFTEFTLPDGVTARPFRWQLQDVGSPQFQLQVRGLDELIERTQAAGYRFLSVGARPIQRPFGRFVFAIDADNILVEYAEPAAAP